MTKIIIESYGKGQKLTVQNPNEELGAVIYIGKNGFVSDDSWLKKMNREEKLKSTKAKR